MYHLKTDTHWYDTIIAYYLGMLYCCLHDHKIKNKPSKTKISEHMNLQNSFGVYIAKVFLSGSLLIITLKKAATLFGVNGEYQLYVVLSTILCCIFLVIVCQRIILGNKALMWLGQHSFEIYMSQRIPMIVFQRIGLGTHKTLFAIVTLLCTLILAFLYKTAISKCPLFRDK